MIEVYTDGASSPDGRGGWAWASRAGRMDSGAVRGTTNQRMEMTAALEAVRAHDGPVIICSDSAYVINCFEQRWYIGWRQRGWINSQKKPVANRDIWEPLIAEVLAKGVTFRKVKGHSGDPMNDLVDSLAVEAKLSL